MSNKMYRIDADGKEYSIYENKTTHILRRGLTKDLAREMVRAWQGGKGFLGWTPSFMCSGNGKLKINDQSEKA